MIYKHDYTNLCWWCGSAAGTGEHRFKKSDLIRSFGRGPYRGEGRIVRGIEGTLRNIQGPNSDEVKFEKNLCAPCNNTKSQHFDRSYDKFVSFLHDHEEKILKERKLFFSDIYDAEWRSEVARLYKYFVKHICCRLAEGKVWISPNVIAFLNDEGPLQNLIISFEIREDILALEKKNEELRIGNGSFWMGDLICLESQGSGAMSEACSFLGLRWLRINYVYDGSIIYHQKIECEDGLALPSGYKIEPESILKA